MLWVALATAIMLLSGELTREGNDARAIAALLAGLRRSVEQTVPPSSRRTQALCAVQNFEWAFALHRRELEAFGVCIQAADRNYRATQVDYAACSERLETERSALHAALVSAEHDYESALTPAERERVVRAVLALPEARVLEPSHAPATPSTPAAPPRLRGIEGVASQRHLTQPRNVISLVYGPLGSATFGQRFPSMIVDGGTTYSHEHWTGSNPSAAATPDTLFTRFGVRFGVFDDFEAGALFVPVELAPHVRLDQVLVFFTQQFRLSGVDLALRASFRTPGGTGWGISPGALLRTPGRRLALQAGVSAPMEVGTVRDPLSPTFGFQAPLRVIGNVTPALFLTGDSGLAYDNLALPDRITVPLGFGVGYDLLLGSRIVEFAASYAWDDFLLPARPNGASAVQLGVFRVAFGASVFFQAL